MGTFNVSLKTLTDRVSMEVVYTPKELDQICVEIAEVNRPGLFLAGYYDYFDKLRLQIMGLVEKCCPAILNRCLSTEKVGMGSNIDTILFQLIHKGLEGLCELAQLGNQGSNGFTRQRFRFLTVTSLTDGLFNVLLNQLNKTHPFTTVKPDNGGEVLLLLRAEVVNLAGDFAVDITGVQHQYFVFQVSGFGFVEEPQLTRHCAGIKEVTADINHDINMASLN